MERSFSIKCFVVGPIVENCYILKDNETSVGCIIDPGDEPDIILDYIRDNDIKVEFIVLTHGHWDHIGAVDALRDKLDAKLAIHAHDASMLSEPRKNLSAFMGDAGSMRQAEIILSNGDELSFGNSKLKVIHTPGHTRGGICLYDGENTLFSGDTLFCGSVGRTDFPEGSNRELIYSIKVRLNSVSDDAVVYPGHGEKTQMGYERKNNPYF